MTLYVVAGPERCGNTGRLRRYAPKNKQETLQMKTILLALAGVVFLNAAHAKEQCSNAILNGTYSLYATGSIVGVGPVGLVAVLKYDGRGTFSAIVFQKVNGNSVQFTLTGTYSVDANC